METHAKRVVDYMIENACYAYRNWWAEAWAIARKKHGKEHGKDVQSKIPRCFSFLSFLCILWIKSFARWKCKASKALGERNHLCSSAISSLSFLFSWVSGSGRAEDQSNSMIRFQQILTDSQ